MKSTNTKVVHPLEAAKIVHEHKVIDADTGEVIRASTYSGSENGKDWWVMYRITMAFIASGRLQYSAVRVFMHLTAKADWRGVLATTRTAIAKEIGLSITSVSDGISELKRFDLIRESKERGLPVFVVNPAYATLGRNKKARLQVFNELPHAADYIRIDMCEDLAATF